jgi:hypothetical protein
MRLSESMAAVIKCFCRCLQYGATYIYEALPRLFTLWLDYSVPIECDEKKTG